MQAEDLWESMGVVVQRGLLDREIYEVMLNPDSNVWTLSKTKGAVWAGTVEVNLAERFVHGVALMNHQYLTPERPYLDALLPFHGERICITIPPITQQVSFNIRKKEMCRLGLMDYVAQGCMSESQAKGLRQAVLERKNIVVCGGPAAGKTTLANSLLDVIATDVKGDPRIVILEQIPELECIGRNVKKMQESEHVDLQRLLWLSLRNSPEWLVIGEVRDAGAHSMLKAFNTGCQAALATVHANSATGALQRLLDLACEAIPEPPIHLLLQGIDVVAHVEASPYHPGKRRLTELVEVIGYNRALEQFELAPLD